MGIEKKGKCMWKIITSSFSDMFNQKMSLGHLTGAREKKKKVSAASMKHIVPRDNVQEKKKNLNIYRNWETPIFKEWAKKEERAKMFEKE